MPRQLVLMEKQTLKRNQSSSSGRSKMGVLSKMVPLLLLLTEILKQTLKTWNKRYQISSSSGHSKSQELSKRALLRLMIKRILKSWNQSSTSGRCMTRVLSVMALDAPHDQPSLMTIGLPNQRLQLVPKEQLLVGERVFYYDYQGYDLANGGGVRHHGIWDGDAVIHVKEPRCNCNDCVAAATFNVTYARKFERGDHLYSPCENNIVGRPMYHQGIYDGKGYVYHFTDSREPTDLDYEKCEECRVRGTHRRENLRQRDLGQRGLGCSGVRKSCLSCFSEGETICRVKYKANLIERIGSTVPGTVSMRNPLPAEEVVNEAKTFYENDSFGEYSLSTFGMSHNCEAFAYYCKTGVYGAKQVTHALLDLIIEDVIIIDPLLDPLLVLAAKAILFVIGNQTIFKAREKAENANKAHPKLVPAAFVPAELYKVEDTEMVMDQTQESPINAPKLVTQGALRLFPGGKRGCFSYEKALILHYAGNSTEHPGLLC